MSGGYCSISRVPPTSARLPHFMRRPRPWWQPGCSTPTPIEQAISSGDCWHWPFMCTWPTEPKRLMPRECSGSFASGDRFHPIAIALEALGHRGPRGGCSWRRSARCAPRKAAFGHSAPPRRRQRNPSLSRVGAGVLGQATIEFGPRITAGRGTGGPECDPLWRATFQVHGWLRCLRSIKLLSGWS